MLWQRSDCLTRHGINISKNPWTNVGQRWKYNRHGYNIVTVFKNKYCHNVVTVSPNIGSISDKYCECFTRSLLMLQDEAAEGATQPGESGNDSGISDAGEHTEAVKDVFDLTLDKMEGILSKAEIITKLLSSMAFSTSLDNQTDPFSLAVFLVPSLTLSQPNVAKGKIQQKFQNFVL